MSESIITDVYVGKYLLVQLVDETIELTVENNVYSYSESYELLDDLQKACAIIKKEKSETYSQQMQDELEPIEEPLDSKAKPFKQTVEERAKRDPEFREALEEEKLKISKQTHVYDICFEVSADCDADDVSDDLLMQSLKARIKNLEDFGIVGEAVGLVDTYDRL